MTKLPRNIKGKELINILERWGFKVVGKRGSHVRLAHPDGRWTQVAVHPKPIPQGTLHAILRQAGLTGEDLIKK
ncbi:MAG TPA: type II toxin-antitoxin system HicA family toxin [Methylomirabilota bacterium]|nr:type II toxin-antitoxin system HicA family toxin [Methylomirabilota bacterium]